MTPHFDFSNKTSFGIQNNSSRYTWLAYHIFVLLSSALGDTIILVASIKYNAIKLDKFLVIIIQHISACDLLTSLSSVLSKNISLVADGWILGRPLCYIESYLRSYLFIVSVYLVCALTSAKLLIVCFPLRVGTWTSKRAHIGCSAVWILVMVHPATMYLANDGSSTFDYIIYDCHFHISLPTWKWIMPVVLSLSFIIPTILVVVSTSYLLFIAHKKAKKYRESLRWQGLTTTILTATFYCISVLPHAVACVMSSRAGAELHFFQHYWYRVSVTCVTLNTISNFYIYCLTVTSFREFLRSQIQRIFSSNIPPRSRGM